MSELRKQAKTLEKWIQEKCKRNIYIGCPIAIHHNCDNLNLINVEVAEKEIEQLKQKLQEFSDILNNYHKFRPEWVKKKFEELLEK